MSRSASLYTDRLKMAELTPDLSSPLYLACVQNAEEAAGALGRAFDGEFVLKPQEPGPFAAVAAEAYSGGGLAALFRFGEEAMIALLPAGGGLVPDWVKAPDVTGESKLSTLAQELSMLLVPDTLMADAFEAVWIENLSGVVDRAEPAEDATATSIEVGRGDDLDQLTVIWPIANPDAALKESKEEAKDAEPAADSEDPAEESKETPVEEGKGKSRVLRWSGPPPRDYRDLPPNVRSFLQVGVVVSADLAAKKMRLSDVIELGPGSIITFEKPCDEPLDMCVGGQPLARGEAVKVGERFGIRVQEMILPDEHFRPMLPPQAS